MRHRGAILATAPAVAAVLVLMVVPVLLLVLSGLDAADPFAPYMRILTSPAYRVPLLNTFAIAAMVTLCCVVLAYPLAYTMATLPAGTARLLLVVVLLPFWTSALVRTTAWLILLQRRGLLNALLLSTGLADEPVAFVYNLSGVLIGMVHVLLPFVALPLHAAFRGLDRNLLLAADSLGATPFAAFRRVVAPLTAPGVVAGALIVFMNALGFYLTPALMGGPGQAMVATMIQFNLQERLDWPMASALAATLLAVTLLLFWLFQRRFGLDRLLGGSDGGDTLGTAPLRRTRGGTLVVLLGLLVAVFLLLPIVTVFPMSLSRSPFLVFPPPAYSWRWYESLLASDKWADALVNSLLVAAMAVPLAVLLGTAAAVGVARIAQRWRALVETVLVVPLVVPAIVFAVALLYLYAPVGLAGTRLGLALGHAVLGLPFVLVTVRSAVKGFDANLELAALSLGAGWGTMFRRVMLPRLLPGIAAGAIFAFVTSFDETILAIFLTDVETRTLPKLMYEGVAHEIDPTITAVAALLILASVALLGTAGLVRRPRR